MQDWCKNRFFCLQNSPFFFGSTVRESGLAYVCLDYFSIWSSLVKSRPFTSRLGDSQEAQEVAKFRTNNVLCDKTRGLV